MEEKVIKVEEEFAYVRLDVYLSKSIENVPSRTFVKRLIESGHVTVNQKHVKSHHKVAAGDVVRVRITEQPRDGLSIVPEKIPLAVFYEDEFLLVVNKPVGMLVHPVAGCATGTLVNALLFHCQQLSDVNTNIRPGIVHRLDRETSGLMCVAKDNRTHVRLARQFEKHRVKKKYVALVKGSVAFEEGVIDVPLGRHPKHFDKKAVSFDAKARDALTYYRVVKRFDHYPGRATLVALYPQSGRTHQLRVHMAYLGHPILGDNKYGVKMISGDKSRVGLSRMGLHAQALGFRHPETKNFVEFSTPLPQEFLNLAK